MNWFVIFIIYVSAWNGSGILKENVDGNCEREREREHGRGEKREVGGKREEDERWFFRANE